MELSGYFFSYDNNKGFYFRNKVLLKVSSWIIGEFTHRLCNLNIIQMKEIMILK